MVSITGRLVRQISYQKADEGLREIPFPCRDLIFRYFPLSVLSCSSATLNYHLGFLTTFVLLARDKFKPNEMVSLDDHGSASFAN